MVIMSKFYHELENIDEHPMLNESDVNESFTCLMSITESLKIVFL